LFPVTERLVGDLIWSPTIKCWSTSATAWTKLKASGMSLDRVIAAKASADYDAKWGDFVIGPARFVTFDYRGV